MSLGLWIVLGVGYLVCVGAFAVLSQRVAPEWWWDPVKDAYGKPKEPLQWERKRFGVDGAVILTVFWPIGLVWLAAEKMTLANRRSMNGGLRLRAELEKELAAARKEVDDLLRKEGVA